MPTASIWSSIIEAKMTNEHPATGRPGRPPTHPGEILKEDVLPTLGLSVSEAARQFGVSRQLLNKIMAQTHPVTPEMAVRLGRFCGNGAQLWSDLQTRHDVWHAEEKLRDVIKRVPKHTA